MISYPVLLKQIQLISEVRNIIRPQDLDYFNRMTIDKEIAAAGQVRQTYWFAWLPLTYTPAMTANTGYESGSEFQISPRGSWRY